MNKEKVKTDISYEEIALCAYHAWEDQGRPVGQDREIWFQAEAWLNAVRRQEIEKGSQITPIIAKSEPEAKRSISKPSSKTSVRTKTRRTPGTKKSAPSKSKSRQSV